MKDHPSYLDALRALDVLSEFGHLDAQETFMANMALTTMYHIPRGSTAAADLALHLAASGLLDDVSDEQIARIARSVKNRRGSQTTDDRELRAAVEAAWEGIHGGHLRVVGR